MGNVNRYVTGMILAAAIIVFGGFFFLRGAVRTIKHSEFDMSYNMPRPKSALYNFFFGLEGREIERTEINPFKDKKADEKKATDVKNLPKIDLKKQEADKKIAQQKAAAAAAAQAAKKKAEVKVNVVNAAPASPLVSSDLDTNTQSQSGGAGAAQGPISAGTEGEARKDTLSSAQWRALLSAQPTKSNVAKLITAFNNKEVDANTLYLIMNDLMQSSNSDTQGLGLLIAQSVPSLRSFSLTANNYEKLDATNKKTADTYMMSYMQGSKLSILALALQSDDTQVVTHAAQVMVSGLEAVRNGQTSNRTDTRTDGGRGVVSSSNKNAYSQFVPILQNLVKSSDGTVASLAQNALTQIQSLSNT